MSAMPFAGLGFDMETVSFAADAMSVTRQVVAVPATVSSGAEMVAQPSGYSLLVSLGREIRGR